MGKSAPEWGNQPRSPTPRCSSLPPGPSRRRRFLGHRGYARNADASSQIESSCPGPATSPRTLPAGTAKPTLVWGRKEKASRGEAESPQHLCCLGGASTALPVPNQCPGSATRLACPLCAGLDGSRDTQHVHPRDPRLLHPHPWHGRGPQSCSPGSTRHQATYRQDRGGPQALHSLAKPHPCLSFPSCSPGGALPMHREQLGGGQSWQPPVLNATLGLGPQGSQAWSWCCSVGRQRPCLRAAAPKGKLDSARAQGQSGHRGHGHGITRAPARGTPVPGQLSSQHQFPSTSLHRGLSAEAAGEPRSGLVAGPAQNQTPPRPRLRGLAWPGGCRWLDWLAG